MFLDLYNFFIDWLWSGGIPSFLSVEVTQWISFGCSCATILAGIIIISLPLFWLVDRIVRW